MRPVVTDYKRQPACFQLMNFLVVTFPKHRPMLRLRSMRSGSYFSRFG